jgi:hypothetical protein
VRTDNKKKIVYKKQMILVLLLVILILLSHLKILLMHKRINALYQIITERDNKDLVVYNVDSDVMETFHNLSHDERLKAFNIVIQFDGLLKDEYFADAWKSFHSSSSNERTESFRRVLEQLDPERSKLIKSCLLRVKLNDAKVELKSDLKNEHKAEPEVEPKPEQKVDHKTEPEATTVMPLEPTLASDSVAETEDVKRHEISFEVPEMKEKIKRKKNKKNKD